MLEYWCSDCGHIGTFKEVVFNCKKCKSPWLWRARKNFQKHLPEKDLKKAMKVTPVMATRLTFTNGSEIILNNTELGEQLRFL